MFDWSIESLKELLDAVPPSIQVIFAHPHYHNHKRIVHCLIDQPSIMYIRFEGSDLIISDIESQIKDVIGDVDKNAFTTIVLDECDRAEQNQFNTFLRQYTKNNPKKRVVVISRLIAHDLLEDEEFRQYCQFIPTNDKLMLYDYAKRDTSRTLIEVQSFGSGQVYINGRKIDQWDGILPRQLFFYLADRGMATRHDIFATFWEKLNSREATNVFHVTKRKITDILGQSFTKFGGGFYRISPEIDLSYDAIRFTEYIQSSVIAPQEEAIQLLEYAITLYRASFLNSENDAEATWIGKRREELTEMYGEALAMLAEHRRNVGDHEQALGYYLAALRILNHHEDIVATVMEMYQQRGQIADALELYEWIETNLQEDYGIVPNATLQSFADKLKQE